MYWEYFILGGWECLKLGEGYLKRGCGGHSGTQDSPNAQQSVKENGFREREEETPDSESGLIPVSVKRSGFLDATHPDDMLRHSPM